MNTKLKKIINKTRYIIEFIATIIFVFFIAKTFYTKRYFGYFHKLYLTGTIIWFAILLINIIYNFKKSDKKIEKIFLNVAIPIGILFMVFMIPGHVPDETTHFIKAYDVSMGHILTPIDENGDSAITVPKGLAEYNHTNLRNYQDLVNFAKEKTDYNDTEKIVSTAQGNFFIMYIFSAIGFFIARILNIGIIYGILLGKMFNFIFFLIMGYLAIKKIPFGKIVFTAYTIMPMNLQQVTSISADAFINSILLYYVAYSIYMIFKKEKITKKEIAIYIVFTAIAGIVKMVYILIAGVGFLIVKRKDMTNKNKILTIVLTIVLGGIFTIGTLVFSTRYTSTTDATIKYQEEFNVDSGKQINEMIHNPKHAIKAFTNDWYDMGKHYIYMSIGSELGWLEIKTSETVITLYLIVLIIAVLSEKNENEFNWKNKIWLALITAGVIILVEIAMYTGFTPIGAEFIGGIQGRYYIPVYILLLLCLAKKDNYIKINNIENKIMILSGALNLCVISEIMQYFL